MHKLYMALIRLLEKYGRISAGMPSYHGSYETAVPQSVQESYQINK